MFFRKVIDGREVMMGKAFPVGYGLSYRPVNRHEYVMHPIPINVLVGAVRSIWSWCVVGFYDTKLEEMLLSEYNRGRRDESVSKMAD